ncbi:MAG: 2-succinyl-5-enolpyruvyl-6-hydroxy-3-cyclohexene-1-carboxylic-acid synthase [Cyclobacteriaceae bacterium]|nr:2-succinyl-5-enolpyruvyl-6-hydroxy-3-cyclohexene-1-carboxylic-acid synthase [Cyclobacteriaceae bacterium]
MSLQSVFDIAEVCARHGIHHAVISPGSRNAALTLAFARHPAIKTFVIPDERSAGYIALGMAQQSGKPVVVICTSGTAVYNLGPAVAEAFFQQIPLIVITADRPPEWVAQQDGQTLFQQNIFGHNVKQSFQLPVSRQHPDEHWHINRMVNESINLSLDFPQGPVHINAPFREPFYPAQGEEIHYSTNVRIIKKSEYHYPLPKNEAPKLQDALASFKKVLIVAGQLPYDKQLVEWIEKLSLRFTVLADITSNLHECGHIIRHGDLITALASDSLRKNLQPDLLITFGQSVLSKNLKVFLRKYPATEHWHIQPAGQTADTFQHLTRIIHTTPLHFMEWLTSCSAQNVDSEYYGLWKNADERIRSGISAFFNKTALSELHLISEVIHHLSHDACLHLANSMSIRYASLIGLPPLKHNIQVYANRGTSGIDGCTSTAVGHCLVNSGLHVLITGDLAFFYDRNAFWHNYPLPNLRIIVLNNHGGIIFKLIDGPAYLPEADEYFVTRQPLNAKHLCSEYGFEYVPVSQSDDLRAGVEKLFSPGKTVKILELETSVSDNVSIFEALKSHLRSVYAT